MLCRYNFRRLVDMNTVWDMLCRLVYVFVTWWSVFCWGMWVSEDQKLNLTQLKADLWHVQYQSFILVNTLYLAVYT